MVAGGDPQAEGVGSPLRRLAESILAVVENRLSLATVELNLEKYQAIEVLFWGAACFSLGFLAMLLLTFTVVVVFWESGRLTVLIGLTLVYLFGAAAAFFALKHRLKSWPTPFTETIAEIKKDRACLKARKS
jgi:uncharacterized membrane protein YqjE